MVTNSFSFHQIPEGNTSSDREYRIFVTDKCEGFGQSRDFMPAAFPFPSSRGALPSLRFEIGIAYDVLCNEPLPNVALCLNTSVTSTSRATESTLHVRQRAGPSKLDDMFYSFSCFPFPLVAMSGIAFRFLAHMAFVWRLRSLSVMFGALYTWSSIAKVLV
jgi:hypothetical protein